ncbi:PapB/FocB family fimbrial expression transcriptional regulator [Shewanella marina]|uniref:PapB/FocB family fimbrial expression transcriptional regulator n=1 Tax=Shewanella marina TaxID=487319 RepID=UPI0004728F24|nr:PapB/FocB family fimbrial expression transcriptional regulator [Shewanella marina]
MNALITGGESFERIALLLSLTKITSESIRGALTDYFVIGHSRTVAAALNGVDDKNLAKAIKRLQRIAHIIEQIKQLDLGKIQG